jgi:hypothetical protein
MSKKASNFEMWPVYQYGDHPKGTATIGEMAGTLMHGNAKTKVMRLNNAIRTSKTPAPKPVGIVGGRVGGLSFIYNVAEMVKWRKAHVSAQASKRENVMQRAVERAENAKRRAMRAQKVAEEATAAKARYRTYAKMRQNAEKLNAKEVTQ